MNAHDVLGWVQASKAAVDLLKSAYAALPTGDKRSEVENKVRLAEQILERGDAKLAKELASRFVTAHGLHKLCFGTSKQRRTYVRALNAATKAPNLVLALLQPTFPGLVPAVAELSPSLRT